MAKAQHLGSTKTVDLDELVFGQKFNGPLVHECVIAELAARRQGTAATKTRGLVAGGSAKPWRQKGTGQARAGTRRSPIWRGGGIVFGPSPRHYTVKVNRKARRAALRAALSVHAERESLFLVDAGSFDKPSTKKAEELLGPHKNRSVLVLLADDEAGAGLSFRNLPYAKVVPVQDAGVVDIISAATLVLSNDALETLNALAAKQEKREVAA